MRVDNVFIENNFNHLLQFHVQIQIRCLFSIYITIKLCHDLFDESSVVFKIAHILKPKVMLLKLYILHG